MRTFVGPGVRSGRAILAAAVTGGFALVSLTACGNDDPELRADDDPTVSSTSVPTPGPTTSAPGGPTSTTFHVEFPLPDCPPIAPELRDRIDREKEEALPDDPSFRRGQRAVAWLLESGWAERLDEAGVRSCGSGYGETFFLDVIDQSFPRDLEAELLAELPDDASVEFLRDPWTGSPEPATWELDDAHPSPGPTTTELHLRVFESSCSGGDDAKGRVAPPEIDYGADTITITAIVIAKPGAQTCPALIYDGEPLTVTLDEPLGDRELVDGGPAARDAEEGDGPPSTDPAGAPSTTS